MKEDRRQCIQRACFAVACISGFVSIAKSESSIKNKAIEPYLDKIMMQDWITALHDSIDDQEDEATCRKIIRRFAIIISCLGLFGLATFTAERRRKEIGVRKVFGSSRLSIFYLLSGAFTKQVLAAILIASLVSYVAARYWLNTFAYKINLEWWFFSSAGIIALFVAWLSTGSQAIKAANMNPAMSLKEE
jgi:hypothetical protein